MGVFPFKEIEKKWQNKWEEKGLYKVDIKKTEKKLYNLVMFSYPSGATLHIGHWYNYGPNDSWARMKRMQGYNVFEPMGFDAFGLPAENYAVKTGKHPQDSTLINIKTMETQLKRIGAMYDWDYEVVTCDPDYYKWTQWIFLQLYRQGLAYRKNAPVNWCPSCQTVLANEQVLDGTCERCGAGIIRKNLTQWFFKITAYADRLLENIDGLDWPERTKHAQKNWIGRSHGAEIRFEIKNHNESFTVFTTRPDTLFGVTYLVMAPEHPLLDEIVPENRRHEVKAYQEWAVNQSEIDRLSVTKEKTGVFTGAYAVNPVNGETIPIWVSDYVLVTYGTGLVMAVPAHDQRDYEFATQFALPVRQVITPLQGEERPLTEAYTEPGRMINSGEFDGMESEEFKERIIELAEEKGFGQKKTNYRLRDWLISRQRYWGAPIPIIHCPVCGEVPVPEEKLPVKLPYDVVFEPTGESPLVKHPTFRLTSCPVCGAEAEREVDTMDTFVDSSWYFLRYPDPQNKEQPFDKDLINQWLPVDKYVGGPEHAVMHLLYARFMTMALKDMGYLDFEEPFKSLRHQGIVLGRDGNKMSKSKGNTVIPDDYITEYGTDVFRMYLMFAYDYAVGGPWDDSTIKAIDRFIDRVWRLATEEEWCGLLFEKKELISSPFGEAEKSLERKLHLTIKGVTEDTEDFHFNTAIAKIMELNNEIYKYVREKKRDTQNELFLKEVIQSMILLLAPFAPHVAEELWERSGKKDSAFNEPWPRYDEDKMASETVTMAVQINGKVRGEIRVSAEAGKEEIEKAALTAENVTRYISGKTIVKKIIVPGRLVNIVVKDK
ncbi:MAG TPA: leucine--tRNA ligase [Firmicutes bacterium]|nr:leucine--tRNA ligase [Bacillota bacterium]